MADTFFFILLCIGCWRSFVIATDPCVPKVRGEPFVQYVEKNNCEVDEKLSKLFSHMSFNETANFMCIGFIDALSSTSDLTLESICRFGLLGDIPDGNFCSDTKMMTVLEKVTSPMKFNKSSLIVANFTRQHCDMMCDILSDGSNELCWAFGITAKLVLKQSVVSTTPPITTEPTTLPTSEPSVTTQSLILPTLHPPDKTNTATSDGDDDDSHDNHKDEDHDHNNDDHDHNNDDHDHNDDDHDHNDDDHDHNNDDHDHNDDDHDHNDDDHDHNDDEHDRISDEHDHNDEDHERVNDGHDDATDSTPVKVENNTSSEDDKEKMGSYFDPHNTQDEQHVSNTVGQDAGEGDEKHDNGVAGTDIADKQEASTSISNEGTKDVHDNAINQITNTNDIATEKNITSDEGNTSTSVELDPNDDDLFEDHNFDGDQNGKQNDDDDDSDQGGDQDNSDHDGSVNHINVIEVDDDDDDDGYSYWHFAAILLFILFIGVAGYLASHNRKKV